MRNYLEVLRVRDYRLLWSGAVLSLLGDGVTWTVLSWMVTQRSGASGLGVVTVCYTFPVILGGLVVGPLLDRFSRRFLLIADSVVRGLVVASVPLAAAFGSVPMWQLYLVAVLFGLFRIVPLGAVPAVVPELVDKPQVPLAAMLEIVGYGVAGVVGPALGGVLIPVLGSPATLLAVVGSYTVFGVVIAAIRAPLARPQRRRDAVVPDSGGWRPVLALMARDKVLLSITVGFAMFNFSAGMLRVANPWLAADRLSGGSHTLGLLLASYGGAQLVGSLVAGSLKPSDRQMRRIGVLQILAGGSLLFLLVSKEPLIVAGLVLCGLLSSPMSVSSQVIRVLHIPVEMRGRSMTFMRTLMNGAIPLGSVCAAPMLQAGLYRPMVLTMAGVAALPGAAVAIAYRKTSFGAELGLTADAPTAAVPPTPPLVPQK